MITEHVCEYENCEEDGVVWDTETQAWLCKNHEDTPTNWTGYCSRDCMLGGGCDGSC